MANLDLLLQKIEKNYETKEKTETEEFTVGGNTFEVRTMTRKEKSDIMFSLETGYKTKDVVQIMIKPIYYCFNLKDLAVRAKDAGYIKNYYEVVEMLFDPIELFEIITYLFIKNGLNTDDAALEEISQIKK